MELKLGNRYFGKPRAGATIRDPFTKQDLPEEGGEIVLTEFYVRRHLDGDLFLENPGAKKEKSADLKSATKGAK